MSKARRQADRAVARIIDYKEIFNSEKGRRVLFDLMKACHYFESSYQGDVNDMVFREGERNVITYILTKMKQDPKKLLDDFMLYEKERIGDVYDNEE